MWNLEANTEIRQNQNNIKLLMHYMNDDGVIL